jgi:hypothetical protein
MVMNIIQANISNLKFCLRMKAKRNMPLVKFLTDYLPSGVIQMNRSRAFVCGGFNKSFFFGGK